VVNSYLLDVDGFLIATVVAALKAQSIDGARLSASGFGPDKPIAPNDTEEDGGAKNRRIERVKN
jgi:OOP family OmpA-OmpF porin